MAHIYTTDISAIIWIGAKIEFYFSPPPGVYFFAIRMLISTRMDFEGKRIQCLPPMCYARNCYISPNCYDFFGIFFIKLLHFPLLRFYSKNCNN